MSESARRTLQTVTAVVAMVMLVTSLSALAVERVQDREGELVAAEGGAGGTTGGGVSGGGFDPTQEGAAAGTTDPNAPGGADGDPNAPGGAGGDPNAPGGAGGDPNAPGSGGGDPNAPGGPAPPGGGGGGGQCADYNPNEGVFCDRFLIGGTTVLSGPLAIYGEQGLRGGQAWIEYFRREIAPRDKVRSAQLVYYDDGLDPNKTVQFVQRLVEVDKVLVIGGVTSPEAVADYLDKKQVPMIGDIGLSPRSYMNDMIFPTAAPYEVRADIRTAIAKRAYPEIKAIAVIQEILPGVDSTPIDKGWEAAAKKHGLELSFYTSDLSSTDNQCKGFMLRVLNDLNRPNSTPTFVMLPIAAPPMLACMREAANSQAKPQRAPYNALRGWSGGSNLQFEVDQCGEQCFGMFSGGTPFLDPRTNPHPNAKTYLRNMARYAPGIDVTGFITINYYHAGLLQYEVMKQGGILQNLSRANLIKAAKRFGPFETGFGNTVQWRDQLPRVPTTCGYNVILDGKERRWVFGKEKVCV